MPPGKIKHAPLREQAASPDHVRERIINEQLPEHEKGNVSLEGHPIYKGAGDECRRDDGEHHLVSHEDKFRQIVIAGEGRVQIHPVHERFVKIPDESAQCVAAEAKRIAADKPHDGGDAHRNKTLDHDPENISFARKPAVEKGEPGRHQHDEAGGEKHEAGSSCVEHMIWSLVADVYNGSEFYSKHHFSLVDHTLFHVRTALSIFVRPPWRKTGRILFFAGTLVKYASRINGRGSRGGEGPRNRDGCGMRGLSHGIGWIVWLGPIRIRLKS